MVAVVYISFSDLILMVLMFVFNEGFIKCSEAPHIFVPHIVPLSLICAVDTNDVDIN